MVTRNPVNGAALRYSPQSLPLMQLLRQLTSVDYAQSIRQIFYRVVDTPGSDVPKTEAGYRRVQRLLKRMREDGLIPYNQIVDQSRLILLDGHTQTSLYNMPEYYAEQAARQLAYAYQEDYWQQKDMYLQVWCESRGAAATIQETCRDYGVGLIPAGGQTSLTLIHEGAKVISARAKANVHILYIGDFDEAGVNIGESVYDRLYGILPGRWSGLIHFDRIAITEDQIANWNLPTKPAKTAGRHRITETVEVETIPVPTLRNLVSDTIEGFLPLDERNVIAERIKRRRDDLIGNQKIIDTIAEIARGWNDADADARES